MAGLTRASNFEVRWAALHERLRDDYRESGSEKRADCADVAQRVGDLLLDDFRTVDFYTVLDDEGPKPGEGLLVPQPYQGRIKWRWHVVAASESLIFDPILPSPVSFATYREDAFVGPIIIRPYSILGD